jgi:capsular polysaccharide biosynthesis protein
MQDQKSLSNKIRRLLVLLFLDPRAAFLLLQIIGKRTWRSFRGHEFHRGCVRLADSWRLGPTGLDRHVVSSWVADGPEPALVVPLPYPEGLVHSACYGQRWSYTLSDVVLDPSTGVLVANDHLIAESLGGSAHSAEFHGSLVIATSKVIRRCRHPKSLVAGPSTVLPASGISVFGHFLWYALPNILRCKEDCAETLTVLVPEGAPNYIFEALSAAGLPVKVVSKPTHVEELWLAASAYVNSGDIYNSDIHLLRREFLRLNLEKKNPSQPIQIYASRVNDPRRQGTADEKHLEQEMEEQGFQIYHGGSMTFTEQVDFFREADLLVAPTGSGLANMVWMNPGARVVELGNPEVWVAHEIVTAATNLDLNYGYVDVLQAFQSGIRPRELASRIGES